MQERKCKEQSCGLAGACDKEKGAAIDERPRSALTRFFKRHTQFAVPWTRQAVDDGDATRQFIAGSWLSWLSYGNGVCRGHWRSR